MIGLFSQLVEGANVQIYNCLNICLSILSNVINESICDGVFPDNLKIAKVVPVFKSGDSEIPTNYRPISVLRINFRPIVFFNIYK